MESGAPADTDTVSLRVGIDLVSTASVSDALTADADRYLSRIYTSQEVADCRRAAVIDPQRLAARFAAKEAVMKVLRPSADHGIAWSSISVQRGRSGAPSIRLSGGAAALADRQGIGEIAVSLTHEGDHAAAVAIARAGATS